MQVGQGGLLDPLADAEQMLRLIGRLPMEVRQPGREMHGMLAGTTADFEHARGLRQVLTQHLEDRPLVAITGLGKRLHGEATARMRRDSPLLRRAGCSMAWLIAASPPHTSRRRRALEIAV